VKKKAANGYKMPDPIPLGEVVHNNTKDVWTVGKSIGVGGFGEIYLCCVGENKCNDNATLAMKIEPHENGPLFVEMNFYLRTAKAEMVEEFRKKRGLKSFGMPVLRGSGNHTFKGSKYRFLVMDRYSKDLDKFFQGGKQVFSNQNSFTLAIKILDTLEYIHSKGYVHNDIKAQNLMLGYGSGKENDVYLVDFGLVSKYFRGDDQKHVEYKPDPRFAHDGTIEYLSRDAHNGIKGRRSDLEILGYNLVHWLSGNLPWMDSIGNPKTVQAKKEKFMSNIPMGLKQCFGKNSYPNILKEFLNYVTNLKFEDEPNYKTCRSMFEKALKNEGANSSGKLDFSSDKRSNVFVIDDSEDEGDFDAAENEVVKHKSRGKQPVAVVKSPITKDKRKGKDTLHKIKKPTYKESASQTSPNFVRIAREAAKAKKVAALAKNPEMEQFVSKSKAAAVKATRNTPSKQQIPDVENMHNIPMDNPTPAMLELMRKKEAAKLLKTASKRKPVLSKLSNTSPRGSKKSKP